MLGNGNPVNMLRNGNPANMLGDGNPVNMLGVTGSRDPGILSVIFNLFLGEGAWKDQVNFCIYKYMYVIF